MRARSPARACAALALVLTTSCFTAARPDAPVGLPEAEDLQESAFGGYVLVELKNGQVLGGELIALGMPPRIHLLSGGTLRSVPVSAVKRARLIAFKTQEGRIQAWGLLGTLSTLSHGFFLILTAPTWMIGASGATWSESADGFLDYPAGPIGRFVPYARFPQGMPPGMTLEILLKGRPPVPVPPPPPPTSQPTTQPTPAAEP